MTLFKVFLTALGLSCLGIGIAALTKDPNTNSFVFVTIGSVITSVGIHIT
jgi:hypothetical protein